MIIRLATAILLVLSGLTGALAQSFQTKAKQAIVMDYETGSVLRPGLRA